ncbi:MAG TPA: branched-chain amino acid ABC transporter permease [Acidimicrobiia bacterium]|jgi:branched-chain amino acid transport system permease protein
MTQFLEACVQGIAIGAQYALVALGFVIIYRATGVINFAQGGFVVLGAYFAYDFHVTLGIAFYPALVLAMLAGAVVGVIVEATVLRRLIGQPPFVLIMITIGVLTVIEQVVPTVWGANPLPLGDPWGVHSVDAGKITIRVADLWTIGLVAAVLIVFFLFFRYSKMGVAMRATAVDLEASLAQGISVRRVVAVSWGIAGLVAALAGVTLAGGGAGVRPDIELVAFLAFPAIILGGLDSPGGAVVGGLVIGVTQSLTATYQPQYASWLGTGFNLVVPYIVMVIILMVRPYGLFGQTRVRRA